MEIDGNLGDEIDDMGNWNPFVDVGDWKVDQVSSGGMHSCAIVSNGTSDVGNGSVAEFQQHAVKCWGANTHGQLGYDKSALPLEFQGAPTVQLGSSYDPVQMCSGWAHNCALSSDGLIKCWGRGLKGQLGYIFDVFLFCKKSIETNFRYNVFTSIV